MRKEQISLCSMVLTPSVQRRKMPRGKASKVQPESLMVLLIRVWACGVVQVGVYLKRIASIQSSNCIGVCACTHTHNCTLYTHAYTYTRIIPIRCF